MTPFEAIEKQAGSYSRVRGLFEGVALWSDVHILAPGDFPGKDQDVAKVWAENLNREGEELATVGVCVQGSRKSVYRSLDCGSLRVWINEAYRQTFQADGVSAHIKGATQAITFRRDGELVGIAMPVRNDSSEIMEQIEPTDEAVWGSFACAGNGFFRQSRTEIRARFTREYSEAVNGRSRSERSRDEAIEEIAEYSAEISDLESQIAALDALDKAEREASEVTANA